MKQAKVLFDFVLFALNLKVIFFRTVLLRLTGNPFFTDPDVSLNDAKIATDLLDNAIQASQDGGHTAISIMHDYDKSATLIFKNLAHYVERLSNGEETKILSSGFNMRKQPAMFNKEILAVTDGPHSGSVKLTALANPRAGSYYWKMCKGQLPEKESDWVFITVTTQSSYRIEGLDPGVYYYFTVAITTPEGLSDFCPAVKKLIN